MMLEFLKSYKHAVSLDEKKYDQYFPEGVCRADFLLFDNRVICEVKDFEKIDIPKHVERVWAKGNVDARFVGAEVARSIHAELRDKAGQIRDTRAALCLRKALGLVILENRRPTDLSSLVLVASADWELQRRLEEVDGVLCLDFVNTFTSETDVIHFVQFVARQTKRACKLSNLIETRLMADFTRQTMMPLRTGYDLASAEHTWETNADGTFRAYRAKINFASSPETKTKTWQLILRLVAKWAWVIGLIVVLIQWLLRRSR